MSPSAVGLTTGPPAAPSTGVSASSRIAAPPSVCSRTRHKQPRLRTSTPTGSSPWLDRCSTSPSGNRRIRIGVVGIRAGYLNHEAMFGRSGWVRALDQGADGHIDRVPDQNVKSYDGDYENDGDQVAPAPNLRGSHFAALIHVFPLCPSAYDQLFVIRRSRTNGSGTSSSHSLPRSWRRGIAVSHEGLSRPGWSVASLFPLPLGARLGCRPGLPVGVRSASCASTRRLEQWKFDRRSRVS
jgi:hypothetical protein